MEVSILIQNILEEQVEEQLKKNIGGLDFVNHFCLLLSHQVSVMDLTKELIYTYDFLNERNKLRDDYFLQNLYSKEFKYTSISIESNNFESDFTLRFGELIAEFLCEKFPSTTLYFFIGEDNKPYKIFSKLK
jgi:hypothetical protein